MSNDDLTVFWLTPRINVMLYKLGRTKKIVKSLNVIFFFSQTCGWYILTFFDVTRKIGSTKTLIYKQVQSIFLEDSSARSKFKTDSSIFPVKNLESKIFEIFRLSCLCLSFQVSVSATADKTALWLEVECDVFFSALEIARLVLISNISNWTTGWRFHFIFHFSRRIFS